jgi:uncharacterized protein
MIPYFPKFKKIELSDMEDVEKITQKYPLYSDFNFSNIWSWDLKEEMGISILNNNLVVQFTDYVNGQPFLSFLGDNMINETARELVLFSQTNFKADALKLVPEMIVNSLDKTEFDVISDRDSYDYVYSIVDLANMDCWSGNSLSKGIRQFRKKYPNYIVKYSTVKEISDDEYLEMFKKWAKNKNIENHFEFNEYKAFERMLQIKSENIKIISLYLNHILIGFTLFEIMHDGHALSHFAKADTTHCSSVYSVLNWEEANIFKSHDIKYYNWQQDLGVQGMRDSKIKYKPAYFMKKFLVKKLV